MFFHSDGIVLWNNRLGDEVVYDDTSEEKIDGCKCLVRFVPDADNPGISVVLTEGGLMHRRNADGAVIETFAVTEHNATYHHMGQYSDSVPLLRYFLNNVSVEQTGILAHILECMSLGGDPKGIPLRFINAITGERGTVSEEKIQEAIKLVNSFRTALAGCARSARGCGMTTGIVASDKDPWVGDLDEKEKTIH